jgi:glycosyltransferase involved in cell wall biosynthesis
MEKNLNIIVGAKVFPNTIFEKMFSDLNKKPQQQIQIFMNLIIKGFSKNVEKVFVFSHYGKVHKNLPAIFKYNNVTYNIFNDFFILLDPIIFFFRMILFFLKNKFISTFNSLIVCDPLDFKISIPLLLLSKFFKIKSLAILTDLPIFLYKNNGNFFRSFFVKIYYKIINFSLRFFDSYVFLTKQMNPLVNKKNKPFLVIEGMVDYDDSRDKNKSISNSKIIYAGGLQNDNGLTELINGFEMLQNTSFDLCFYGDGELKEFIIKKSSTNNHIKYCGVLQSSLIVEEFKKAKLLVNPRPSNNFTQFSFPSKLSEYLVSGTPVLSTCLPGIPEEYYKYFFQIKDESAAGIKDALSVILNINQIKLHSFGKRARNFILKEKNCIIQTGKIIKLYNENVTK